MSVQHPQLSFLCWYISVVSVCQARDKTLAGHTVPLLLVLGKRRADRDYKWQLLLAIAATARKYWVMQLHQLRNAPPPPGCPPPCLNHVQIKALGGSLLLTGGAAAGCFWLMQDLGLVNPDSPTSSRTLATAWDMMLRPQAVQQAQQELQQQQRQQQQQQQQQQQHIHKT
jgi:hypothetical protein